MQSYYTIAGRDLEREIIPMATDQQLGLMIWSPLAGGFLSGKFTREGAAASNDARRLSFDFPPVDKEHAYDIIDAIKPIAEGPRRVGSPHRAGLAAAPKAGDKRHHRREVDRAA